MIIHQEEVHDLIIALEPLARSAEVRNAYWISTPDGEYLSNNGNEWCRTCGLYMVRHLKRQDRKRRDDYLLDGGWTSEHDTPPACAHCGVRLKAHLTIHGAAYELDHFRESPPQPGCPDDAYSFVEILYAVEYVSEEDAEIAEEAISLAKALVLAQRESVGA